MILTVSELNAKSKAILEANLFDIELKGEISRLSKNQSGHWYFTLKDKDSSISCAMFKFANSKVKFEVKDGLEVVLSGKVSIYSPSGSYQFIVNSMRVEGDGELERAFELLKQKLFNEGLFDPKHKKSLPAFPKNIAIITSPTSAAYQDMLRVINDRFDGIKLFLYKATMQGNLAVNSIIKALTRADLAGHDAIVIARGGGSREDLWCFNDESLARAVFMAKTPIISAIGHEIDFTILDFVSDHRSLTPTASMVDLLPDKLAIYQWFDELEESFKSRMMDKISKKETLLNQIKLAIKSNTIGKNIALNSSNLQNLELSFRNLINSKISNFTQNLAIKETVLREKELFYKVSKDLVMLTKDGLKVSLESLKSGEKFEISSQISKKEATLS